ncbi:UDP-glucose 4-epimerase family protein [Rhodoferax sp.]|uniref:UDP-glucose 4-epimerase family protein n=1 Tax=Rhodoferax sp. TaxID=50421 RepID=UPI00274B47A2|nr:SDR family oxidoreductase [Rhodoferax sp.]
MNVLVTGASGFVGRALVKRLGDMVGVRVIAAMRRPKDVSEIGGARAVIAVHGVACPLAQMDWSAALPGVEVVVHLAARVHIVAEHQADSLAEFRAVNVDGTLNLARQCAKAGVKRFVFLSSVKVNGEATRLGHPFAESDVPAPQDAYAVSKFEAEQGLLGLSAQTGMEIVIIRPPLVYGPGVKANFAALMRAVRRGWPLPLGAVRNRRSLVALDNLVDFIVLCHVHPLAANQTFLVSDGQDLSTPELVRGIAAAAGTRSRLVPVPAQIMRLAGALVGKRDAVQRLCGNLQVDISKARGLLGWRPPITVDEGLRRALAGVAEP